MVSLQQPLHTVKSKQNNINYVLKCCASTKNCFLQPLEAVSLIIIVQLFTFGTVTRRDGKSTFIDASVAFKLVPAFIMTQRLLIDLATTASLMVASLSSAGARRTLAGAS